MRVLPHAVVRAADPSPDQLIRDVLLNGILTHGHPRALIGAIVHALAIKSTLQRRETLGYGELVECLRLDVDALWFRRIGSLFDSGWRAAAEVNWNGRFDRVWMTQLSK